MASRVTTDEAERRLRLGNTRFVSASPQSTPAAIDLQKETAESQNPFAVVIGCSDSRVPPEIVFDQSIGDLFVIRVAGNVVAAHELASVEFALTQLSCPLIVVLGHSRCGAVSAAFDAIHGADFRATPALARLVDEIRPGISAHCSLDTQASIDDCIRANVRVSISRLVEDSWIVRSLLERDALRVVGATYCLDTGRVQFHADDVGDVRG